MCLPIDLEVNWHEKTLVDTFLQCVYAFSLQPHSIIEFLGMRLIAKFHTCLNDSEI